MELCADVVVPLLGRLEPSLVLEDIMRLCRVLAAAGVAGLGFRAVVDAEDRPLTTADDRRHRSGFRHRALIDPRPSTVLGQIETVSPSPSLRRPVSLIISVHNERVRWPGACGLAPVVWRLWAGVFGVRDRHL